MTDRGVGGYGSVAKLLHWLIVALLVVQYAIGWLMPDIRRGMVPGTAMNLHISIGFVILAVIVARFLWRLTHPVVAEASLPPWQRVSSEGVHWLLYLLVLATTITGWAFTSMRGWSVSLFWTVPLPALTAEGSLAGEVIGEGHETLIWILAVVILAHVGAALLHLFVFRDGIMERMLPKRWFAE
jgi:cytochrome b561